MVTTQKYYTT